MEIIRKSTGQEIKLTGQILNFSHKATCLKNSCINKRVGRTASFGLVQAVKSGSALGVPVRMDWHEHEFKLRVFLKGTGEAGHVFFSGRCILETFVFF